MKFESEYIEKLAKIISENGLTEISLEDGEQAITLRKEVLAVSAPSVAAHVAAPQAQAPAVKEAVSPAVDEEVHTGKPITSPMVGTFYRAPSPDAEPFVKVGSLLSEGDVVCIVEAMKMMNEIESEISGKVVEICVEDGQPVEFGQVLMYVE